MGREFFCIGRLFMIKTVADYLETTAALFPDKVAFDDNKRTVTFSQFRSEARAIASALARKNLFKQPVAIYFDKQVECLSAMIGVTYSGNFYTVLDIHSPQARIETILDTLRPTAIITDRLHVQEVLTIANGMHIILYEDALSGAVDGFLLHAASERIVNSDVMFVLFTSGSTGIPKGVVMPHKAVIPYVEWGSETFPINASTVFCNQAPFYFVASCFEIFQTLRNGCTMYLIPRQHFLFPVDLLEYVSSKRASILIFVPSVLCMLANLGALKEVELPSLQYLMFGGEVMPAKQINMWRRAYPHVKMVNLYGMTEMMDDTVYYLLDRELEDSESVPIGRPCEHMDVLLLNEEGVPVRKGEIGELYGRGPSMALGYFGDPVRTAKAFVQNPLNSAYPEIVYKSGDLCRVNEWGEIVYVCRKDFQIKHMGNRIELGEIETACSGLPGVKRNCCLYDEAHSRIVLFYEGEATAVSVKSQLRRYLPEYMCPNHLVKLDELPLNQNGKIDRTALKERI